MTKGVELLLLLQVREKQQEKGEARMTSIKGNPPFDGVLNKK